MKRRLPLLLFLLVFCHPVFVRSHFSPGPAYQDLIIEIPGLSKDKSLNTLRSSLEALNGVVYSGFCDSQKYIMLKVNRDLQPDDKNILNVISSAGYIHEVKLSGTIEQAVQNCKDRREGETSPTEPGHD